jgi:hypothetical protein
MLAGPALARAPHRRRERLSHGGNGFQPGRGPASDRRIDPKSGTAAAAQHDRLTPGRAHQLKPPPTTTRAADAAAPSGSRYLDQVLITQRRSPLTIERRRLRLIRGWVLRRPRPGPNAVSDAPWRPTRADANAKPTAGYRRHGYRVAQASPPAEVRRSMSSGACAARFLACSAPGSGQTRPASASRQKEAFTRGRRGARSARGRAVTRQLPAHRADPRREAVVLDCPTTVVRAS